jgi:hypothetical protein
MNTVPQRFAPLESLAILTPLRVGLLNTPTTR